jgi:glucoamylase
MISLLTFVAVAYLTLYAFAFSIPSNLRHTQSVLRESLQLARTDLGPQSSFNTWLEQEEKIALDKLLRNVAPGGANAPDAAPGTVIASPSKEHPNYYYQCMLLISLYSKKSKPNMESQGSVMLP